ncbi:MAG TPA: acetylornithine transaminase [Candidatus Saccharimonadales bacterium]|nr:acetylornithine transaminase [Candidatus Saccharimonadales bacterium]
MKDKLKKLEKSHIMQTYKRTDVVFVRGEGCYLYDSAGKRYLDFIGGLATCSVGHGNKQVAKAVADQASELASASNLYYSEPQVLLAKRLSELSGLKKCFFCHSGAEANEAAIKLAKKVTGKKHFIAFKDSFHGRTTGSLALTWKNEFKEPFLPLSPKVTFVDFNDVAAIERAVNADTAAVFIEPVQGEAGVNVPENGFLRQIRELCDSRKILMIVDEVQTGVGRTGKFFAYQHEDIKPDIVTVAKGLGGGLPIGVCIADYELEAGEHGSTLGGNNVSAAAALATLDYIKQHNLTDNAARTGDYLQKKLIELKDLSDMIKAVRGKGLMIAIELKEKKSKAIVSQCLSLGLVCNAPTDNVIRFLPPLTVTKDQIDEALQILRKALA